MIHRIIAIVAYCWEVDLQTIVSKSQKKESTVPRQIVCLICREHSVKVKLIADTFCCTTSSVFKNVQKAHSDLKFYELEKQKYLKAVQLLGDL